MSHFFFDSELEALAAEALICANIRGFVQSNIPEALTEDGSIRSRWANGSGYSWAVTSHWETPRETVDGKWAVLIPTFEMVAPVPLPVTLAGAEAWLTGVPEFPTPPSSRGAS